MAWDRKMHCRSDMRTSAIRPLSFLFSMLRSVLQDLTEQGARSQEGIRAMDATGRFFTWGKNPSTLQIQQIQSMANGNVEMLLTVPDGVAKHSSISPKTAKNGDAPFSLCTVL
jgi:hypothetical protein